MSEGEKTPGVERDVDVVIDPENITIKQRLWLTEQMAIGKMTPASVAKKYNVDRHRVKNWVYKYRKGLKRRSIHGRPRALDSEALKSVKMWIEEDNSHVQDTDELKKVLTEAYHATKRRLVANESTANDADEESIRNMSKGTLYNYLKIVQSCGIDDLLRSY